MSLKRKGIPQKRSQHDESSNSSQYLPDYLQVKPQRTKLVRSILTGGVKNPSLGPPGSPFFLQVGSTQFHGSLGLNVHIKETIVKYIYIYV